MPNSNHSSRSVVMIVDDSLETLSLLNTALESRGYTVLVAMEGGQAVTIASTVVPDIILLDALMPNLDGFDTCRRLKQVRDLQHVPVIFMTGLSDTESVVKAFEAGGVDYVTKPIRMDELFARLNTHIQNARQVISSRVALDSAGQYLLAANDGGELLWTTAQARSLLSSVGLAQEDCALAEHLRALYRSDAEPQVLELVQAGKTLQLAYLSQVGPGEHLVRLRENQHKDGQSLLQSAFDLTRRESQVLLLLGKGNSNREIAELLHVSPRTVTKHLEQVYRKLGVQNRTAAAALCMDKLMQDRAPGN